MAGKMLVHETHATRAFAHTAGRIKVSVSSEAAKAKEENSSGIQRPQCILLSFNHTVGKCLWASMIRG